MNIKTARQNENQFNLAPNWIVRVRQLTRRSSWLDYRCNILEKTQNMLPLLLFVKLNPKFSSKARFKCRTLLIIYAESNSYILQL